MHSQHASQYKKHLKLCRCSKINILKQFKYLCKHTLIGTRAVYKGCNKTYCSASASQHKLPVLLRMMAWFLFIQHTWYLVCTCPNIHTCVIHSGVNEHTQTQSVVFPMDLKQGMSGHLISLDLTLYPLQFLSPYTMSSSIVL